MSTKVTVELRARDLRFLRAASDVVKRYRFHRSEDGVHDGPIRIEVHGGSEDYIVTVHPRWEQSPTCTCPDASRLAKEKNAGYCKHIIAVLLREKELQYQLLEVLL
jgi:predicted nucleic acid-binding Zn finger protein